ncbi:MAG: Inosine-5'-monophosphate dehydrogenase [Gammaproteobacteria bacterium]|nr:Inosine-5'-monophosphate dehydrogenase [Gammaproteobacteria bacterium]
MKIREILSSKSQVIYSASPTESLGEAVNTLVKNNCGALVVMEGERMVGIVSERDVLRACAELKEPLQTTVSSRMTSDLVTATPDDDVEKVMRLLTHHRIRHLPIMETDRLVGVISIGDIVKVQHEALSNENRFLKQYIQG